MAQCLIKHKDSFTSVSLKTKKKKNYSSLISNVGETSSTLYEDNSHPSTWNDELLIEESETQTRISGANSLLRHDHIFMWNINRLMARGSLCKDLFPTRG
jgi:hypothetical protein